VKLYSRDISPFSARVRVSILAKALPIQIVDDPDVASVEYGRLNVLRRVPVLTLDDGTAVPESDTIVEYLEDAFPQVPLRPAAPAARARVRLIARVAELYVFPACLPIFGARRVGDPQQLEILIGKLDEALTALSTLIEPRSTSWHAWGDTLTTADGALAAFLFYAHFLGQACERPLLARHRGLERFWEGAQTQPELSAVIGQMAAAMATASARS
jgi:glutathione S-transferase